MAAIELKHSAFIHIPKCGGRSVNSIIMSCVDGAKYIGDPIYDAHERPAIGGKTALFFVRHPIMLLNSLWEHRGRSHGNSRHKAWNWQQNVELERICGRKTLEEFFACVVKNPGIVTGYYEHWIGEYRPKVLIGKVEDMRNDLIGMLNSVGESFNAEKITQHTIGKGSNKTELNKIISDRFNLIEETIFNEECFCNELGYTARELKRG